MGKKTEKEKEKIWEKGKKAKRGKIQISYSKKKYDIIRHIYYGIQG